MSFVCSALFTYNSDEKEVSAVRSFRIDAALNKELLEAAERDGYTLSTLFNILVKNYLESGRVALQVNRIIIAPATLLSFLEHLKPEQCREDGLKLCPQTRLDSVGNSR